MSKVKLDPDYPENHDPDMCECPDCENERYNKPCPYNPKVMCVQMPDEEGDCNYCDDGCPNRKRKWWVPIRNFFLGEQK